MIDNEDTIRMAIDAGATGCANPDKWGILEISYENLERFAALVAAYERERLAQPEPEPVGKFAKFTDGIWREVTDGSPGMPLYAYPSYGLMGGDEFISKDSAKRMIV
jgi:hypothetical protein